jgi:hypothetical protein
VDPPEDLGFLPMSLSADQRAMLELLLERGQSYEDLSSLLGISSSEVRSKARWALAELGGADPDRNVGLTDYLLGQADPIGRADAVRHLRNDAADRELAERLVDALGEVAPGAEMPSLPGEGRTAPHMRAQRRRPGATGAPAPPKSAAEAARTRLMLGLGSAAAVLLVVVLAVAGVFSGGGDSSTASTTTGTTSTGTSTAPPTGTVPGSTITPIPLNAVGGGPGSGAATFGLATGDQPFLDIHVDNLPPAPTGQVYAAWLVTNTKTRDGYPLAPLVPYPQSGPYHDTFTIPSLAIPLVQKIESVDITVAPANDLKNLIQGVIDAASKNPKNAKLVLPVLGNTVLRGVVPRGGGTSGG